MGGIC